MIYMPVRSPSAQSANPSGQAMTLLAKAGSNSTQAPRGIEQFAKNQDAGVPVSRAQAFGDVIEGSISEIRATMPVSVGLPVLQSCSKQSESMA